MISLSNIIYMYQLSCRSIYPYSVSLPPPPAFILTVVSVCACVLVSILHAYIPPQPLVLSLRHVLHAVFGEVNVQAVEQGA